MQLDSDAKVRRKPRRFIYVMQLDINIKVRRQLRHRI